jgi:lysophospholipase L1-like esterase
MLHLPYFYLPQHFGMKESRGLQSSIDMEVFMNHYSRMLKSALAGVLALALAQSALSEVAAPPVHWGASWIAPAQPTWSNDFVLPLGMPQELENATLRQGLRLSVGGKRIRLVISNEYGDRPLKIGSAQVGLEGSGASAAASFQGAADVLVAPGAQALSDPIALDGPAGARLRVDLYLPQRTKLAGFHWDARERNRLLPGNMAGRAASGGQEISARAFLSAVLVESARPPMAVVALGDSITDGNGATPGADQRWPDFLARRLAPRGVAVLDAGISGNRLLRPGMGESALARLQKDVLQQPGVRAVIVLLGTNDIGWPGGPFAKAESVPTVEDITRGYRQLVEQAHLRGVRVIGGTLAPFEDALQGTPLEGHYSPHKEATRQAVNEWIRSSGVFDAVVDFDKLLRDPPVAPAGGVRFRRPPASRRCRLPGHGAGHRPAGLARIEGALTDSRRRHTARRTSASMHEFDMAAG